MKHFAKDGGRAGRRPGERAAAGDAGSEALQNLDSVLAGRTGEIEAAVERTDIMLVGEVGRVGGYRPAAVVQCELRIEDVAILDLVAELRLLEQGCPLPADMAEIDPRRQRVAAADREGIFDRRVEGDVGRVGLPAPGQVDAIGGGGAG